MFKQGNELIKTVCINFASFTIIITSVFLTTDLTLKILLVLADYRIRLQTSDVNSCMVIIFVLILSEFLEMKNSHVHVLLFTTITNFWCQ